MTQRSDEQLRELAAIFEMSNAVAFTLDLDSILSKVADTALQQAQADEVSIMLPTEDGAALEIAVARGARREAILGLRIPIDQGIAGWVARHQEMIVLDGEVADARFAPIHPRADIRSSISLPMLVAGSLVGVLNVNATRGRPAFTQSQAKALAVLANIAATAIKTASLYTQTREEITARRRSEEVLRETNRQLELALSKVQQMQQNIVQQERLRALGQMASGIAHDFNNELAMIVGFCELLLNRPEFLSNPEKARSYLQMIRAAAGDATDVVDRLREFYRHRDEAEVPQAVNLNRVVEQAVLLTQPKWKYQAQAKGVTIEVATELEITTPVLGNASELREALTNLILNAVDALPVGGTLTIRTALCEGYAVLQVSDTGTGMSEEVRRRCLEPFFTTKGERGSGLGLSLVYGVVDRHGGTIEIDSHFGRGTTFTIRLPLDRQDEQVGGRSTPRVAASSPRRILVVDDEAQLCRILTEYLAVDGHTVEIAGNGREGVAKFLASCGEAAPSRRFDLVITDLAMPEMSGDQLAQAVKQVAPTTPVILLTGFGEMMRAAGEQPSGVDLVVAKPVSLAALQQALSRVLVELPHLA